MLTCAAFQERIYDEDCRDAGSALPADVAAHADACPYCARTLDDLRQDAARIPAWLAVDPPAHLRVRALHAAEVVVPPRGAVLDLVETLSYAAAGGVAGALALSALPIALGAAAGFIVGAALGVTFKSFSELLFHPS